MCVKRGSKFIFEWEVNLWGLEKGLSIVLIYLPTWVLRTVFEVYRFCSTNHPDNLSQ